MNGVALALALVVPDVESDRAALVCAPVNCVDVVVDAQFSKHGSIEIRSPAPVPVADLERKTLQWLARRNDLGVRGCCQCCACDGEAHREKEQSHRHDGSIAFSGAMNIGPMKNDAALETSG